MLKNHRFVLSAVSLMAIGLSACTDDDVGTYGNKPINEVCVEGAKSCDGDILKTCLENGDYDEKDCTIDGQICDKDKLECVTASQPFCTSGAKSCEGNVLKTCKEDGSAYEEKDCSIDSQICDSNKLECVNATQPVCTSGAKSCEGNVLKTCKSDGSGYDEVNCVLNEQKICDSQLLACVKCRPGSKICEDNAVKTCKADGSDYEETLNCNLTNNQICDDEDFNCRDNTFCKPNKKICALDVLKTCKPDGSEYDEEDCEAQGLICDNITLTCTEETHEESCTGDETRCEGKDFWYCTTDHVMDKQTCTEMQRCDASMGCVNTVPKECTETMNTCIEGNTKLSKCNLSTHKMETIDCTSDEMVCNPDTTSCEYECDEVDVECDGNTARRVCNNHHFETVACPATQPWCVQGECIAKSSRAECIELGKAYDESTGDCYAIDSLIGQRCVCNNNCTITITGKEFKNVFSYLARVLLGMGSISEKNDKIEIPNFFPGAENISGCGDITVPEGMSLGCLHTGQISATDNIVNFLRSVPNVTIMNYHLGDYLPENFEDAINRIADLLDDGIDFEAPNGYCVVGDIDVGNKLSATALGFLPLINDSPDPLDKTSNNSLAHKINTGVNTHAVVDAGVQQAAADERNYCPEGSTIFSFSKKRAAAITGDMFVVDADLDMAIDLCLQACDTDDNCRKDEGYKCLEIRSSSAAEGQDPESVRKKQACFIQSNLDALENLF